MAGADGLVIAGQSCSARSMSDPSDTELEARYRPLLEREAAESLAASDATRADRSPVTLDQQTVGRLSRMDALQGQAMAKGLEARRVGRRRAVLAALQRIDDGEFGFCEDCGSFIGTGRLDVDPCAMRCVSCAG
jgi:DnaK suppressor protein